MPRDKVLAIRAAENDRSVNDDEIS